VLVEALLIGLIASVVGILFGIGVAVGLQALFDLFGASLPQTTLQVAPRTIIVGLVVGVVVTLVAAVGPALRASRVPPIAAMRDVQAATRSRRRAVIATVVGGIGLGLVLLGTLGGGGTTQRLTAIGVGAVLMFVGSGMLTQYVARPLASVMGLLVARIGTSGRLGRDNAMRNPRRTAQTASALTIGVALVAGVTVFASSLYQTFAGTLDERIRADVLVQDRGGAFFSPAASTEVGRVSEVAAVTAWRDGQFKDAAGDTQNLGGVDPATFDSVYDPDVVAGSLADLAQPGTIAISQDYATDNDLQVGDALPVLLARTGEERWRVAAVFDDTTFGAFFISLPQFERSFTTQQDTVILARAADGVTPDAAAAAVDEALSGPFPNLDVYTKDEYKDFVAGQINQFLYLFYILLAMAVVIAVFGIVLTLALSVFERTREIGLLRAVGMSRRGVRAMIRWEAVIVALIGALVGLVLGVFLGVVAVRAVPDLDQLAVPWVSLAVFLVLAAIFGVLAAILPARRAARLDVLQAIQAE
ncbi:MAG TPA: FtsX-like permease family protein, partial [Miltoncostaeaceae bacterium]|nr:FtsX-like permease family protein [Miltoncostaeaceae bacterium]